MASIYDLTEDYLKQIDTIIDAVENGEEIDQDTAMKALGLQDDIKTKAVNTGKYVKNLTGTSDAIDNEIKRLQAKKKAVDNRIDWLKGLMLYSMQTLKIERIDDDILPIRVQANSQWVVNITDIDKLPSKYKTVKKVVTVDKKLLLANKDKLRTTAVEFTKGSHLRIGT